MHNVYSRKLRNLNVKLFIFLDFFLPNIALCSKALNRNKDSQGEGKGFNMKNTFTRQMFQTVLYTNDQKLYIPCILSETVYTPCMYSIQKLYILHVSYTEIVSFTETVNNRSILYRNCIYTPCILTETVYILYTPCILYRNCLYSMYTIQKLYILDVSYVETVYNPCILCRNCI